MIRLIQTCCLAAVAAAFAACVDTAPMGPGLAPDPSAARQVSGTAAPAPSATCSFVQVNAADFETTVTWTAYWVTRLTFVNGGGTIAVETFDRPKRSGSITVPLPSQPDYVQVIGRAGGQTQRCTVAP